MKYKSLEGCCTARVIFGLSAERGPARMAGTQYAGNPVPQLAEQTDYAALYDFCTNQKKDGQAMIIATTNNFQTKEEKLLTDLGFKSSRHVKKTQHSDTKVKLWWRTLDDWPKRVVAEG